MKRIALTLAALAFSTSSVFAEDLDGYGSVLLDEVANNRGIDSDINVGDSDSLFDVDADSGF